MFCCSAPINREDRLRKLTGRIRYLQKQSVVLSGRVELNSKLVAEAIASLAKLRAEAHKLADEKRVLMRRLDVA